MNEKMLKTMIDAAAVKRARIIADSLRVEVEHSRAELHRRDRQGRVAHVVQH